MIARKLFGTALLLCSITFLWGQNASESTDSPMRAQLKKHVYTLASDSLGGRLIGSDGNLTAGEYIADLFAEIGLDEYNGESYFNYFEQPLMGGTGQPLATIEGCNVVGLLRGNDPVLKDQYIVFGAHYDHLGTSRGTGMTDSIYNGADDNASGTAVLIELARALKAHEKELLRTVVFVAFDGEEQGLWGSTHFVQEAVVPIEKIMLMVSMDMVGFYRTSGYLKLAGCGTLEDGKDLMPSSDILHLRKVNFEASLFGATDTQPFAKQHVPTLYMTTGLKSPYHKPQDEAELIDYSGMADITEYTTQMATVLATYRPLEASGSFADIHVAPEIYLGVGPTVALGSNHTHFTKGALDGKSAFYYNVGAQVRLAFQGAFEIDASALLERLGNRYTLDAGQTLATSTNPVSPDLTFLGIGVPVSLRLNLPGMGTSPIGGFVSFDAYYRYLFDGYAGKSANKVDFDTQFNRHEGGLGYTIGLRIGPLQWSVSTRYGLTGLLKESYSPYFNIKNHSCIMSLAYFF